MRERRNIRHQRFFCGLLASLAMCVLAGAAHARSEVLVVFDEDKEFPGLAVINRNLQQSLRDELQSPVEFYTESLNLSHFDRPGYEDVLRDYFQRKYQGQPLDLIIAVMEPALDFLLRNGDTLFPGVPIVFCGGNPGDVAAMSLPQNATGVLVKRDFAPSLDVALRLQPNTRNVFVVGGTSRFDRQMQATARRELQRFNERVSINWLTDLPMQQLLKEVSTLPRNSVIYYLTLFVDQAGEAFIPHAALSQIAQSANAPVYVAVDQYVGLGAIGGYVYSVETLGQQAAAMGVRVLRGEAPAEIPVATANTYKHLFDWRELERWDIDERLLPRDSQVEYRPVNLWFLYKWYIVAGASLFLLQTALVLGMFVNRAQRRRAEILREQSENRRLRAEDEVRRQRDELAHALRVTTLGEMTASFAHELGQPLAAIAMNAAAAEKMVSSHASTTDLNAALHDVLADASRAAETLHRLRALFRKQPPSRTRVDIHGLIRDALRLLEYEMRHRQIRPSFEVGEKPSCYVLGDAVQLQQVLINVLINASEAISASVEAAREINIEIHKETEGWVEILIQDTGMGVKDSDLEQIFQHFVSTKPQGLGMGLAISRSIIEAHDGRIWATRNARTGLTMHIMLPLAVADTEPEAQQFAEAIASRRY